MVRCGQVLQVLKGVAVALVLLCLAGPVQAADLADGYELDTFPEKKRFAVVPYFWAPFFNGSMTVNNQRVEFNGINVLELISDGELSFPPFVLAGEWSHGPWGVMLDTTILGLEFARDDFNLRSGPVSLAAGLDYDYVLSHANLNYDFFERTSANWHTVFEGHLGLRYTYYRAALNVSIGPLERDFDETLTWVDGIVGARLSGAHVDGWNYRLYADIGTGGADISAQGLAVLGKQWQFDRFDLEVFGGYRALYQDWSSGNDAVDLTSHGPLAGLRFTF
ncbi:hypothetical protein PUV47_17575 [Pseudovibrio exalbescens]|uniref:hypothetical protein n=1 Tax=Pseudovibrio exalbescens TaxID=197461 RepID=UPI00236645E4|nr:hypothetical protein [Pseudovibrio exalbescens]MDD7911746.1 hypothetical protein [Pseudovibrio exalbescens]